MYIPIISLWNHLFFAQNPEPPASSDRSDIAQAAMSRAHTRIGPEEFSTTRRFPSMGVPKKNGWLIMDNHFIDDFRGSPVLGNLCIYIYTLYIIWFVYMLLWNLGYMVYIYIMIHNQFHGDLVGVYIYIGMINGVVWSNACNIELHKHRKKPWLYRLLAPIKMGGV